MTKLSIDREWMADMLRRLLEIPSPAGYTDQIVHFACSRLGEMGIPHELTRRGAIRADLKGLKSSPDRAVVSHLDTIGAMVRGLKRNGRLKVAPVGTWSPRFAEGARADILTRHGRYRGTILPLKASGHTFGDEVDGQPSSWDNLEIRVDERCFSRDDLKELGIGVGDYVAVDPQPEFTTSGYVASRHLDNKGGIAAVLAAAKALKEADVPLPVDCHLLFTIFEEVGSGASGVLHQDVAEMVSIDGATVAPGQSSTEHEVTVAFMDSHGPFDYHLSHKLLELGLEHGIPMRRDIFKYYRTDAASAVEAGNDIRVALVAFGIDASHGWERTHLDGLAHMAELLVLYMQSPPTFERDRQELGPPSGFPHQPT
jgi:peptidase M42 family hydrolase